MVIVEDAFPQHEKCVELEKLGAVLYGQALALWLLGNCYAHREGTSGLIVGTRLRRIYDAPNVRKLAEALVVARLWDRHPDGYVIHDFETRGGSFPPQQSIQARSESREDRARRLHAERNARWYRRRAEASGGASNPPSNSDGPSSNGASNSDGHSDGQLDAWGRFETDWESAAKALPAGAPPEDWRAAQACFAEAYREARGKRWRPNPSKARADFGVIADHARAAADEDGIKPIETLRLAVANLFAASLPKVRESDFAPGWLASCWGQFYTPTEAPEAEGHDELVRRQQAARAKHEAERAAKRAQVRREREQEPAA